MTDLPAPSSTKRHRTRRLVVVLSVSVLAALALRWCVLQPASRDALALPPIPSSPFARENPVDPPVGGLRLRSEPILPPLRLKRDPWQREIRGFELVFRGPVANGTRLVLYFDTREIAFNEFGDEVFPKDQSLEAHPGHLMEVTMDELQATSHTFRFSDRLKASPAQRLYAMEFDQSGQPEHFWFVHDSSPAAAHFLWFAHDPLPEVPGGGPYLPPTDFGVRMFGPEPSADEPPAQPLRLVGHRAREGFGMMRTSISVDSPIADFPATNRTATLTLDPNRHEFDSYAVPTGLQTLIGYSPITCSMTPALVTDPSGNGRRVWRLTPNENSRGRPLGLTGAGASIADHRFDLILAGASNGRHRLLIWEGEQLRSVVHLQDALAQQRRTLTSRLQEVSIEEREAMLALHAEDPEAQATIVSGRLTGLAITHQATSATIVAAIQAMPALESVTMRGGVLTGEIGQALARLRQLKQLEAGMIAIASEANEPLGRLIGLQSLQLRSIRKLGDDLAGHISRLTNLTSLALHRKFVTRPDDWPELVLSEAGISQLATLNKLTRLDLHGQNATDANCRQLAALTNLTHLALSGERLTDAGLAALKPLTNLTWLHLWDVAITPAGAEAFKRPGLDFEPGPFGKEHD